MRRSCRAAGFTLVEVLLAITLLGAGVVALVSLQTSASRSAAAVRDQVRATRHAQQAIEQARSFDSLDGLGDGVATEASSSVRGGYAVARRWTGDASAPWRELSVTVAWQDRLGRPVGIDLRTVVARSSPTRLVEASLAAPTDPALRPMARHAAIPLQAVHHGDGTSALPWAGRSGGWLIVDDLTAEVIGACKASVDAGTASPPSTRASTDPLQPCLATSGYLLSGYIGVSSGSAALPADLAIAFAQPQFIVGTPDCAPMVTVADAPGDVATHPRFYICLVRPSDHDRRADTSMVWSARVELRSAAGLAGRTVCRYSKGADPTDNRDHPDTYRLVAAALHNQNFVVTTRGSDCPDGTVLHQRL